MVLEAFDTAQFIAIPGKSQSRGACGYASVITYPFVRHNWQATRFSDGPRFGVWYGSFTIKTTIHETGYHWLRFIEDAFPAETTVIA